MAARITPNREFAFTLNDVARLLRTYADHRAAEFGITRAQWAVMARLDRQEGLKQSELAEMLDLQPITLTRLLDRLGDSGLIERRPDPHDRRAKRLFLTPAARPLLERLGYARRGADVDRARRDRPSHRQADAGQSFDRQGEPAAGDCAQGPRRDRSRAMTDTVLKFRGEPEAAAGVRQASLGRRLRDRLRLILLVIVPLLALAAGLAFYLAGGRTVSTDNAYVGAQKVLVTPDISGQGIGDPGQGGRAGRRRRRAVRDRSDAVSPRAAARRRASSTACAPISTT